MHPIAQTGSTLDYECELVIVIGKAASDVPEDEALNYVLGYAVGNDVSHRDWQLQRGGGQWSLGKGFDGWAPFGPGIVTSKVVKDPQNLKIFTKVNGETVQVSGVSQLQVVSGGLTEKQNNNTKDMIFGIKKTIAFLSQGTTLLPGDVIFTGT